MKNEQESPVQTEALSRKTIQFIGFDLDGTLLKEPAKSFPQIFGEKTSRFFGIDQIVATSFAASAMGIPTIEELQMLPGACSLSPDLIGFIAEHIDEAFFSQPVELFEDVSPALTALREQGIRLFVSSSRPTENIRQLLQQHSELAECIEFAIGTDPHDPSLKKGRAHFQRAAEHFGISFEDMVQQSVFIGDTPSDIQAGTSINVTAIGRTSSNSAETLMQAGAALVLNDFSSLPSLFDSETKFIKEEGG